MAGGSALALQLGHRQSEDFDFFSSDEFDLEKVKELLEKLGAFEVESQASKTMVG